jgi:hypothetical protein
MAGVAADDPVVVEVVVEVVVVVDGDVGDEQATATRATIGRVSNTRMMNLLADRLRTPPCENLKRDLFSRFRLP